MPSRLFVKSKILFKGLAFILIPLAIDTIFCVQLLNLMAKTEEAAKMEHRHMEIVRHANSIMTLYGATSGGYANYATTGDVGWLKSGQDCEKRLNAEFDQLMPLISDLPKMAKECRKYQAQGKAMLGQLEGLGRTHQSEEDMAGTLIRLKEHGLQQFISSVGITSKTITDLAFAQEAELDRVRIQQAQSRAEITGWLRVLIGFNLLLALIMGALFLYDITRRLSILVQNAQLLPKLLPLNERVEGGDELSYLDSVLHDAAEELRNASEQRRYLMEMVAHDIRSPLMSSQVSLEVLSDSRIGELPAIAKRQVDALTSNIRRVI
jgi:hypothetical protein